MGKKIAILILTGLVLTSLTACSNEEDSGSGIEEEEDMDNKDLNKDKDKDSNKGDHGQSQPGKDRGSSGPQKNDIVIPKEGEES